MENELYKNISDLNKEIALLQTQLHKLKLDKQNDESKKNI